MNGLELIQTQLESNYNGSGLKALVLCKEAPLDAAALLMGYWGNMEDENARMFGDRQAKVVRNMYELQRLAAAGAFIVQRMDTLLGDAVNVKLDSETLDPVATGDRIVEDAVTWYSKEPVDVQEHAACVDLLAQMGPLALFDISVRTAARLAEKRVKV